MSRHRYNPGGLMMDPAWWDQAAAFGSAENADGGETTWMDAYRKLCDYRPARDKRSDPHAPDRKRGRVLIIRNQGA